MALDHSPQARGKRSRNKGKLGEREIIDMLQPIVDDVYDAHGIDAPRLQRNLLQSDKGGCDVFGLEWIAPEVKRAETLALAKWWTQTVEQAGSTKIPVLFYRPSRSAWQVRMVVTLCPGCTTVATVGIDDFLVWFRMRLAQEVSHGQTTG
jgi:hypothetical protein